MLKKINYKELVFNPMTMLAEKWMLITAGDDKKGYNTMTASWGHLGSLWGHNGGKPTAVIYIRPQRYTNEFVDKEELFTLSIFDDRKKELAYLGSHSGRDEDKIAKVGLTPVFSNGTTYFKEADLVFVCRKLYKGKIEEDSFVDKEVLEDSYPNRDFHYVYIGEIVEAYVKGDLD